MGFLDPKPLTAAAGNSIYAKVLTPITGESATATTARINAALSAANPFGARRYVTLVGDFTINSAIEFDSNTTFDWSRAVITLEPMAPATNIIRNKKAIAESTIAGCSSTVGSNVITGTGFTPDMQGKHVGLTGAGSAVGAPTPVASDWFGVFNYVSATSGTITPAVIATGGATVVNAGATVASATLKIYGRNSDFDLICGKYIRTVTTNSTDDNRNHSIFLRHVDNFRVSGLRNSTATGKYSIAIGDWTNADVQNCEFHTYSDGLHFTGPGRGAYVSNLAGDTRDDMFSITALDFGAYGDCSGDVTGVRAFSIRQDGDAGGRAIVKVIGGYQTVVRDVIIDGVHGSSFNSGCVGLADDATGPSDISVTLRNVTCKTLLDTAAIISVSASLGRTIELDGLHLNVEPTRVVGNPLIKVFGAAAGTDRLIVKNLTYAGGSAPVNGVNALWIGQANGVKYLEVDAWKLDAANGNAQIPIQLHAPVTDMVATRMKVSNLGKLIWQDVNTFNLRLRVSDLTLLNADQGIIDTQGGLDLSYASSFVDCFTCYVRSRSAIATAITLRGSGLSGFRTPTTNAFSRSGQTGTLTLKVDDSRFPTDVSLLAKTNGDKAWNTNAGLACGVGTVISDGTNWKNTYSGTIY